MGIDVRTTQFGTLFSEDKPTAAPLSARERQQRRAALFAESFSQRVFRTWRATRAAYREHGAHGFFQAVARLTSERIEGLSQKLPDPAAASTRPAGYCGAVDTATPERLLEGYARGLQVAEFCGQLIWRAPEQRMIVRTAEFKTPDEVRGLLRHAGYTITIDRHFDVVVKTFGQSRHMSPQLMHIFGALHDQGFAHCFDIRDARGHSVASGFGIAIGRNFVTVGAIGDNEDQIAVGMTLLNRHLMHYGIKLFDAPETIAQSRLGFAPIARAAFFSMFLGNFGGVVVSRWQVAPKLCGAEVEIKDPAPMRHVA